MLGGAPAAAWPETPSDVGEVVDTSFWLTWVDYDAPIATGWRDSERVDLDDLLVEGDHIDLVLAVGGG